MAKRKTLNHGRVNLEAPAAKKPVPILVTDLRKIEAEHREAVLVDVFLGGKCFRFEGRRLIPAEANRVKQLLQQALPPLIPGAKEGDEARYDFQAPAYQEQHESQRRKGRALALWLGYPCFKAEAERMLQAGVHSPESTVQSREEMGAEHPTSNIQHPTSNVLKLEKMPETVEEITGFIEHRELEDDVVQSLYLALMQQPVEVQTYVNFTYGNGSPKS